MPETADPLSRATDLCTKLRAFRKGTLPSSALAVRPRCVGVGVASHPAPAASPRSRAARPVPVPPRGVPGTVPPRREEREPAVPPTFSSLCLLPRYVHRGECKARRRLSPRAFPQPGPVPSPIPPPPTWIAYMVVCTGRGEACIRGSHTWSCARTGGHPVAP